MKNYQYCTCILFLYCCILSKTIAQTKNNLKVEVLPIAISTQNGTGIQIAWQRNLKNKTYLELSYGIIYDFIDASGYVSPSTGGLPIGKFTTEISVKDANSKHTFILPDQSVIDNLNRLGFKQVVPYKSQRLDNYCSLNIGFSIKKLKNWIFSPQIGLICGIANRTETGGALTSNLGDNPFVGANNPQGWIIFQVYARYWYFGTTTKINIERRIKENVFIGLCSGVNYALDSKFRTDNFIFYTGLSLKIGF